MSTPWKPGANNAPGTSLYDPYGYLNDSASPVATSQTNLPANSLFPANQPAAWGLSAAGAAAQIYVGSTTTQTGPMSALRQNQIMGKIADRLGIKPQKGKSVQEQVLESLAGRYGVKTTTAAVPPSMGVQGGKVTSTPTKAKAPVSDAQLLAQIADKMGVISVRQAAGGLGPSAGQAQAPWAAIAQKLGIDPNPVVDSTTLQHITPTQVITQLGGLSAPQIAEIQSLLWQGGFYDPNVENPDTSTGPDAKKITPGHLDPYTMRAFGTMLGKAADTNMGGNGVAPRNITWTDYLNESAQAPAGTTQSILADATGTAYKGTSITDLAQQAAGSTKITVATPSQMQITLQQAFEQNLGRLPTQAELQKFTDQFVQQQLQHAGPGGTTTDAQGNPIPIGTDIYNTGAQLLPGVPTPANAAAEFAQSNNMEYAGHRIGNAAQLLENIMKNGGDTANANAVTAGGVTAYGGTP